MGTGHEWGFCKDCRWWQLDINARVDRDVMGVCIEQELEAIQLRVSGNSGCNHFAAGRHPHKKGSSAVPPLVSTSHSHNDDGFARTV